MNILGVDAGSGSKSATGLALLDINDYSVSTVALWPEKRSAKANERLRSLAPLFTEAIEEATALPDLVVFESFAMRAKSGETLQRLIGAYISRVPDEAEVIEIANTKIKQFIGGTGKAEKEDVAEGVINWFANKNKYSVAYVERLLEQKRWDEVDAIAIAISGVLVK